MQVTFIISLIFAIIVALFAILNSGQVTINFLFREFETSQALVILISAAAGAIIVYGVDLLKKLKSAKKIKSLQKEVSSLESEVESKVSKIEELLEYQNELQGKLADSTIELQEKRAEKSEVETEVSIKEGTEDIK